LAAVVVGVLDDVGATDTVEDEVGVVVVGVVLEGATVADEDVVGVVLEGATVADEDVVGVVLEGATVADEDVVGVVLEGATVDEGVTETGLVVGPVT